MESSGFRLPATPLLPNDPSLTIQAIGPGPVLRALRDEPLAHFRSFPEECGDLRGARKLWVLSFLRLRPL